MPHDFSDEYEPDAYTDGFDESHEVELEQENEYETSSNEQPSDGGSETSD
jgi:hypothetical protein